MNLYIKVWGREGKNGFWVYAWKGREGKGKLGWGRKYT